MAWADNFNTLYSSEVDISETKYCRFALEEHKRNKTLQINIRMFSRSVDGSGYSGPTKHGIIQQVESIDDVEDLQEAFTNFFEAIKDEKFW